MTMSSKPLRIVLATSAAFNIILLFQVMVWKCTVDTTTSELAPSPRVILVSPPSSPPAPEKIQNGSLESIVFVGGVPRSGTTLARVMLDAHPDIRCGEETRVVPRIISMRAKWHKSGKEHERLLEAGLSDATLDQATKSFVDYIITHHGEPAKHLCIKDPLLLNYINDLNRLYPKAKFILMIRDGRAVAHSIVTRNITISGVNNKDYVSAAMFWNRVVQRMIADCKALSGEMCLQVRYEELVTDPKAMMTRVLRFLGVDWHDNVLHHQEFINKGVSISRYDITTVSIN